MKTSHSLSAQGIVLAIIALSTQAVILQADIIPPPRLLVEPVKAPGLKILGYTPGPPISDPSMHYGIRTASNIGYSWVSGNTATYSLTVTNCPAGSAQVMLIAGTSVPANAWMPAYTESNVIRLAIQANSNGTATATLGLKINADPADPPAVATLESAQISGTWSLKLNGSRAVLCEPGGATNTVDLPDSVLTAFVDPVFVYFGGPGSDLTLSRVQVSGVVMPIDEKFSGTQLNLTRWEVCSPTGSSVVFVPKNARFWLIWPSYNTISRLQVCTSLDPWSWQDIALPTNYLDTRGYQQAPICPDGSNAFFRAVLGPTN